MNISLLSLAFSILTLVLPHGELHKQISALDQLVAKSPQRIDLRLRRAELLRLHGEHVRALKDLQFVAGREPARIEVALFKGRLFMDMNRRKAARRELLRFLEARPFHVLARRLVAANERAAGRLIEAASAYDALFSLPGHHRPQDYLDCARTLEQIPGRGSSAALSFLNRKLSQDPGIIALELEALELEKRVFAWQAALTRIRRLARGQKRVDIWMVREAEVLHLAGRCDESQRAWKAARTALMQLKPAIRKRPATVKLLNRIEQNISRRNEKEDQNP